MEKEKHILVVFPHPDDESFAVAGTLALHIQAGTPVTYMCLTLGEMGRNLGNPPFATRESLPTIRKQELLNAVKAVGIQDLRMMGLRDKTVEFEDDEKLTNMITEAIDELQPSLVITFYPGYSVHPDHEATGRAVVRAIARMSEDERPKLHCVAFSNNCLDELGNPDIVHDIRSVQDKKLAAMKAHRSQTEALLANWEEQVANKEVEFISQLMEERMWTYKF
ncbi:bacillithiol biosynthesis deacetylase BshB2 [Peribacillus asahii]|uniref:Bacillithiol biosynthesis deacetylase BshB2 n=1 Tax=Peribacillus asahii TaxID=228899 RepID=A0A398BF55_9BACI|nr:bacillithiol biosynthesis deacetylase BshB2 [Peribacillus asahii]RID87418.1 bacillithiol biosynthesis deacetylase BshB2 [Peribacillus asahii]